VAMEGLSDSLSGRFSAQCWTEMREGLLEADFSSN